MGLSGPVWPKCGLSTAIPGPCLSPGRGLQCCRSCGVVAGAGALKAAPRPAAGFGAADLDERAGRPASAAVAPPIVDHRSLYGLKTLT